MILQPQYSVPLLRFSEFSGHWERKLLSDIGSIRTGPFGSQLHEKDYVDNGTPIITVEHLGDQGIQHFNLPLVSDKDKKRLSGYKLEVGDIVFSRVGSVDRNSIVTPREKGWLFSGRLLRIRLCQKHTDPKFLSLNLQQEYTQYRIRAVAVGQTMPSLNTEILKRFSVLLPPRIEEQQKIASFLSSIDTRIEQLEKKKIFFEQYKKGQIQKLFNQEMRFKDDQGKEYPDWEGTKLKNVSKIFKGAGLSKSATNSTGKFQCILYGELFTKYSESITEVLSFTDFNTPVNSEFGDVLMPTSDVTPDGLATASALLVEGVQIGGDINVIRLSKKMNSVYMSYLLNSLKIEIMKLVTGTTVKHIYPKDIENLKVTFPVEKEQEKIAKFLSSIDRKIELISEQISQTREFKKGLLQQMFV